jgi:hypothetical protein
MSSLNRTCQWLFIFSFSLAVFAGDQSYTFPSAGRFLLHGSKAKDVFRQCSREAPSANSELWVPSENDIDELETSLARYLDERLKAGKENPPKGTKYHRQYVGFIRNGERYIYGNFYPADLYSPSSKVRVDESKQPVGVCDGGPVFWGIVYRVQTKSFEEPHFNGFG